MMIMYFKLLTGCDGLYQTSVTGKTVLLSLITKRLTLAISWKMHEVLPAGFFVILLCAQGFQGGNQLMSSCFSEVAE